MSCLNALDALAAYANIVSYKNAILHRANLKAYLKSEDKIYNDESKPYIIDGVTNGNMMWRNQCHKSKDIKKHDPPMGDIDFEYE